MDCVLSNKTRFRLLYDGFSVSTAMAVKLVQPEKTAVPRLVTLFGIVTVVTPEFANAPLPRVVTGAPLIVLGMTTTALVQAYPIMAIVPLFVRRRKQVGDVNAVIWGPGPVSATP